MEKGVCRNQGEETEHIWYEPGQAQGPKGSLADGWAERGDHWSQSSGEDSKECQTQWGKDTREDMSAAEHQPKT